jgi:hypothetical protein
VSQDTSVREPGEQSLPGRCSGFGVLSGAAWARWLGILIATISVFVNLTFIPFEPWWAFNDHLHRPVGDPRAVRALTAARLIERSRSNGQ